MDWATNLLRSGDLWIAVGVASAVMFFVTLLAIPRIVARLPADYFVGPRRPSPAVRRPLLTFVRGLARNTLGVVFVLAGLAMLVLPGQGVLTVLLGIVLVDFPGKRRLQRRLLRQRHVRSSLQWLRKRAGRDPLEFDDSTPDAPPES